jgi:ADP-ribose pyrophosphatase YjhB (NUDIX family)
MTAEANAASVALIAGDKVLLIRRAYAPYQHLWTLPGGRMEAEETAEQCAVREVEEELGLTISALRHVETQTLAGTRDAWRLAVFATREFGGVIVPSAEIAEHRWVWVPEMVQLECTPGLAAVVERAFEAADS